MVSGCLEFCVEDDYKIFNGFGGEICCDWFLMFVVSVVLGLIVEVCCGCRIVEGIKCLLCVFLVKISFFIN